MLHSAPPNPTDEELAKNAAAGDDAAMAALITRIMPLAKAKASRYSSSAATQEDLLQEGMLGFLDAVRTYNEQAGASFRTYAGICIQNRIRSAVRKQTGNKHAPLNSSVLLQEDDPAASTNATDPQEIFLAKEDSSQLQTVLRTSLSDLERRVLDHFLAGEAYEEIALALGINTKTVNNALQRVRSKLKRIQ